MSRQWSVVSESRRDAMFIVKDTIDDASSVRSVMSTLRPYGASSHPSAISINIVSLRDSLTTGHCLPATAYWPLATDHCYSYLSAIIGSTFIARRAGTKLAANETPVSSDEISKKVAGSVALTP